MPYFALTTEDAELLVSLLDALEPTDIAQKERYANLHRYLKARLHTQPSPASVQDRTEAQA